MAKTGIKTLTHKPNYYPIQPFFRFCGAFQLSIIYQTKGKIINPFEVFSGFSGMSGFCSPKQLHSKSLDLFGTSVYCIGIYDIQILKEHIDKNHNIILFIGHAYNKHGNGFSYLKALLFQHYISIWGYDQNGFFIYDSSIKTSKSDLPIGNCYIENELLQRCRDLGGLGLFQNVFISIP